jgi:hypothetical protein
MFDLKYLGMFSEESLRPINWIALAKQSPSCSGSVRRHEKIASPTCQRRVAIAANQQFVLCGGKLLENNRHSKFAESYCDKIFDPLEDWEAPKWVVALDPRWRIPNCIYYGVSNIPFRHRGLLVVI